MYICAQRGSNGTATSPIELPAGATSQPSRRWISHHHHHRVCESVGQLRGVCVWEPKRHGYPDTTTTNHSHSDFVRSSPGGYRIVDSSPAERILATTGLSPWSPLLLVRDQANVPQNQVALYLISSSHEDRDDRRTFLLFSSHSTSRTVPTYLPCRTNYGRRR